MAERSAVNRKAVGSTPTWPAIFIPERVLMTEYLLVKFQADWADEFDVYGFALTSREEWDLYCERLDDVAWPQCRSFGTNEEIQWESKEDHLQAFDVKKIDEEHVFLLKKLFSPRPKGGNLYYGHFLWLDGLTKKNWKEQYSEPNEAW